MPQMSPLMWMFLMAVVVMIYELIVIVNYFVLGDVSEDSFQEEFSVNLKTWRW